VPEGGLWSSLLADDIKFKLVDDIKFKPGPDGLYHVKVVLVRETTEVRAMPKGGKPYPKPPKGKGGTGGKGGMGGKRGGGKKPKVPGTYGL